MGATAQHPVVQITTKKACWLYAVMVGAGISIPGTDSFRCTPENGDRHLDVPVVELWRTGLQHEHRVVLAKGKRATYVTCTQTRQYETSS